MRAPHPAHTQREQIRFDWGLPGALAQDADVTVVVDVLSFTTTLAVAMESGIEVFPFGWKDVRATTYALTRDATLAVGRRRARPGEVSLSPGSIADASGVRRLVLPSPNGSALCFGLTAARPGRTVLAASLRNASAVADALRPELAARRTVALVAAGERWPDGFLRPAAEDLWGAGAVLHALTESGDTSEASIEARVAATAYAAVQGDLAAALHDCASGRELVEKGYPGDVEMAATTGSPVVPRLVDESFTAD